MRKTLQILILVIISLSIPTESYSFISALTKGGKIIGEIVQDCTYTDVELGTNGVTTSLNASEISSRIVPRVVA